MVAVLAELGPDRMVSGIGDGGVQAHRSGGPEGPGETPGPLGRYMILAMASGPAAVIN